MTLSDARAVGTPPGGVFTARYRPDIDGLRAFAIALVVVYHVWFGRVSGGVDVFLLISAYLLTESVLRRLEGGSSLHLGAFWSRRFGRLLPAAAVTILLTLVSAAVLLPSSMWPGIWSQSWASLLYYENWQLASDSVDYYARYEALPSPLQHFWSLSIQGQVFVLWPVLLLGVGFVARRTSIRPRVVAAAVFGAVFAASLAYSIISTAHDQQFAYFDTVARLWEFALGSLVAIAAPFLRIGRVPGALLGVAGIIALAACGFIFDVGAGFPGYAALWPTLAAVAVILAGQATRPSSVSLLLSSRPLRTLGTIAYCLYLVHWPILIGYLTVTGRTSVGVLGGAAVVAASIAAAMLLHWLVERPLRSRPIRRSQLVTIAASVLLVAVPLAGWQGSEKLRSALVQTSANPGAAILLQGAFIEIPEDAERVPIGSALADEWIALAAGCTGADRPSLDIVDETCSATPAASEDAPVVLVLGDSHAQQWMGAITPLAAANDWHLVSVLKGGCSLSATETRKHDTDCRQWQSGALDYAEQLGPDVVVIIGTKAQAEGAGEKVPRGLDAVIGRLVRTGAEVVAVRDNPRFDTDIFQCVEALGPDATECMRDREAVMAQSNPAGALAGDHVHVVDLTDLLCPDGTCLPVIGNVVVYLDTNHLTGSYARTMAPAMERALQDIEPLREWRSNRPIAPDN